MSNSVDEAKVHTEVESLLPILIEKSDDELKAEVGQLAIGEELLKPERSVSQQELVAAGEKVIERRSFCDIVCDPENRKDIEGTLDAKNVAALVLLLMKALGIPGIPVAGLVALAVLVFRIGLREYCRTVSSQV